jgi:hypothetical protein
VNSKKLRQWVLPQLILVKMIFKLKSAFVNEALPEKLTG